MIDGLIAGKLSGSAQNRTAHNGKTFVTAKVRAADSDGEAQFISVVAFDDGVKTALLALGDGDSVSASGSLTIDTSEARNGTTRVSIKLVATAVLTPYHVRRKREAIAEGSNPKAGATRASAAGGGRATRATWACLDDKGTLSVD